MNETFAKAKHLIRDNKKTFIGAALIVLTIGFITGISSSIERLGISLGLIEAPAKNLKTFLTNGFLIIVGSFIAYVISSYIKMELYLSLKENREINFHTFLRSKLVRDEEMARLIMMILLKTILWTLLFIVPGIIKALEYQRAMYAKLRNPSLSNKECFLEAKNIMTGEMKSALFKLDIRSLVPLLVGAISFSGIYALMIIQVLVPKAALVQGATSRNALLSLAAQNWWIFAILALAGIIYLVLTTLSQALILTVEPVFNIELDKQL